MRVLIETQLDVEGNRGLRRGNFDIKNSEFKKDPDWYISILAYEWIQKQISEYDGRKTEIVKVTWNEENDITEIVKQIRPIEPIDDLPF
ncbi:hypothetical protein AB1L05_08875 [Cytobacillus horneckiae]|uniref:hypothetical protein n=1 Tax=Cytobacillus horneckiae TaxID=549687 RepID=UPI00399EF51A